MHSLPPVCCNGTFSIPLCIGAGVNNNLFTNINIGIGTRPFNSGGNADRGANSGELAVEPESCCTRLHSCGWPWLCNSFGAAAERAVH